MKFFKVIGTAILLALLIASIVLTLAAGTLRFIVLNPAYIKAFMPTKTYCAEMRERLSEDLEHVALLYGVNGDALKEVVTDDAIHAYTDRVIDALFAENATFPLALPAYPADEFVRFARAHTAFGEEGVRDFSEDCAQAVTEDLSAINTDLIVKPFLELRNNTFSKSALILFVAGLLLTLILQRHFPQEAVHMAQLTSLPWFLAGFFAYLCTAHTLLEPQHRSRLMGLLLGLGLCTPLLVKTTPGALAPALPWFALLLPLLLAGLLLPCMNFRHRRAQ